VGVISNAAASPLQRKIELHTRLDDRERAAVATLLTRPQTIRAGAAVAVAGEPLDVATIVLSGMLCRSKMLPDGRRQILSLLLPGDVVDAHASVLRKRDDNLEAVCESAIAIVPQSRIHALEQDHPRLHEAFLREAFIEAAIAREWVLNVGQRNAIEALAHLVCELHVRMDGVGLTAQGRFPFPLKQQHLADALGLSTIHLNRVLGHLRASGQIGLERRSLSVADPPALRALAHFSPDYLHFDQTLAA
jgi:CRP-like cAMP-binding protein